MCRVLLALTLLVFSTLASASRIEGAFSDGLHSEGLPFKSLQEFRSHEGEGKVDFLKRVGTALLSYSADTGFEACGRIAEKAHTHDNGDGWMEYGVVLTTNESNIGCVNQDIAPEGMALSGKTIHSHGVRHTFRVNAADVQLSARRLRINATESGRDQNHFSPTDMQHPGYLASPTGLLYQNGQGKDSTVENLGPLS